MIGGFCLGGLVAFELAQQIKASGDTVEMLLIIDAAPASKLLRALRGLAATLGALLRSDDNMKVGQFGLWAIWRARLASELGLTGPTQTRGALRRISAPFMAISGALRRRLRFANRFVDSVETSTSEIRERDLPSAFQWASAGYRPQPYDGPVALLLSEDVLRNRSNLARKWRQLAPEISVHPLPGSHLECITAHVDTLAEKIMSCLESAAATAHPPLRVRGSAPISEAILADAGAMH